MARWYYFTYTVVVGLIVWFHTDFGGENALLQYRLALRFNESV
ncbi:hypothetical protein OK016_23365 [Vibrio chagasii]|nr:hypothetical protein [Vibrio chagasii]